MERATDPGLEGSIKEGAFDDISNLTQRCTEPDTRSDVWEYSSESESSAALEANDDTEGSILADGVGVPLLGKAVTPEDPCGERTGRTAANPGSTQQDNTYAAADPELEACIKNGTFEDFADENLKCLRSCLTPIQMYRRATVSPRAAEHRLLVQKQKNSLHTPVVKAQTHRAAVVRLGRLWLLMRMRSQKSKRKLKL